MSKIYNRGLYVGGERRSISSVVVQVLDEGLNGITRCYGATVPTDTHKGYAPGCLFWKSTGGSTGSTLYVNEGSKSSADFNAVAGGGGSISNFSLDDAYNDGSVLAVDAGAVDFAGVHATNNTVIVRATGSGNAIDLVNSGTGKDIDGTSSTWSVTKLGAAVFTAITGCDALTAAANLTLEATSTGTITIGGTSTGAIDIGTGGGVVTIGSASLTITGAADADAFIITAGDVLISDGHLTMIQPDNEASIELTCAGVTTTYGLKITADGLTSGSAIYVDSDNGASFSGQGGYMHFYNGTTTDLFVGRYGAMTITGNAAGTNSITLTAGDLTMTSGHLIMTAGNATMTLGDLLLSDGSITVTDADNAATIDVTNNTITTANALVDIDSSSITTGAMTRINANCATHEGEILELISAAGATMAATGISVTMSSITTGAAKGISIVMAGATTQAIGLSINMAALTTGTGMLITTAGVMTTTGELISLVANSATTCTGLLRISGTGLTDGWTAEFTGGGATFTANGGMLNLQMGAATVGTAINITTSGVYTGTTGLIDINAASATTGTIVDINAAGLTEGVALKISATEATLTTGDYIQCYDGAAVDFKVEKYGATTIAGNAAGTSALTLTAGDVTLTSGHLVLTSGNATLTAGNLTLTLGNLVMTSGDFTHTSGTFKINNVTLDATALEINRVADLSSRLVAAGADETATLAAHSDRIILLDTAAGSTVTLPAATGSGARIKCIISVIATSNSHIIKVGDGTDTMKGSVLIVDSDTAGTVTGFVTAADSDTITLNRTTQGSVTVGEWIELVDIAADVWAVSGVLTNSGSGATPFSATV
jgi:hypothetical protein